MTFENSEDRSYARERSLQHESYALGLFLGVGLVTFTLAYWLFGSALVALIPSLVAMGLSLEKFVVFVPEVTGLYTADIFSGKIRCYGEGMHIIMPWERYDEEHFINLRIDVEEFPKETFSCSGGGGEFDVSWSIQYRPRAGNLDRYISINQEHIVAGIKEVGNQFLSQTIANMKWEEVKGAQSAIAVDLAKYFESKKSSFEATYGVEIVIATVSDIDYTQAFLKALTDEQGANVVTRAAKKMREESDNEMSMKDAVDAVLANAGKADMRIVRVGGETPAEQFVNVLSGILGTNPRQTGGGKK